MKNRILAWVAAAVLALSFFVPSAQAVTLKSKEVGWLCSRVRDTLAVYLPSGVQQVGPVTSGTAAIGVQPKRDLQSLPETTMVFSSAGMQPPPTSQVSTASKDTVVLGWIRFFTDSGGVAVTNTLSSISYVIEGSSDGGTWAAIQTHASNTSVASGDQAFGWAAIWYNSTLANALTKPSPLLLYPQLRVRITAATGNFFAARCQLLYWGPDNNTTQ